MAALRDRDWWLRVGSPTEGFRFMDADGRPVPAGEVEGRIRSLAIPPAWTGVRVSPDPDHKVQAWGYDAAGRKQYVYSPRYVQWRAARKWGRVLRYARLLPRIRAATDRHLARPGLDRLKVLATVVRLTSRGFFRIGSERYAVQNRTFGICTLRKSHVRVHGDTLVFTYPGKRRKDQRQVIADTPLVAIIRELLALPGSRLFRYREGDRIRNVTARAVNRYLRAIAGERCTSKDMRTFGGTVRAAIVLAELGPPRSEREAQRNIALCCRLVANELGNTPAICRSAYIHPAVLEEYRRGRTIQPLLQDGGRPDPAALVGAYYPEEIALVRFLERYAAGAHRRGARGMPHDAAA
jgi:DNA topoisomerase-1